MIKNTILKKHTFFGSYAKDNAHEQSDIDIALVLSKIDNKFESQVQLMKLRRNFSIVYA